LNSLPFPPAPPVPAVYAGPAVDKSTLLQLNAMNARGGEPFGVRAARIFLRTSHSLMARMRLGHALQDATAIHFATHTLKSGCAMLGAFELSRLASSLEALARAHSLDAAEALIVAMNEEYPRVCHELEVFVREAEGTPEPKAEGRGQ
jgi:HPt (histidine-containing phosphotransfer) domain-containing protein